MDTKRVEELLRRYAGLLPADRLFSQPTAEELRARLAKQVGPRGPTETESPEGAAGGPRVVVGGSVAWTGLSRLIVAVAAAAVFVALLTTGETGPVTPLGLEVDGAFDRTELFRTTRGQPPQTTEDTNSFFIGVRVDRPAYVRIIILDDRQSLESLPLDRSEAQQKLVQQGDVFGGYGIRYVDEAGVESTARAFIVVATPHPIRDQALARRLRAAEQSHSGLSRRGLDRLERDLRRRFRCEVRVLEP